MTTLAWLGASVAILRLSVYGFQTLADNAIGWSMLVVFFVCLGMMLYAALQDLQAITKKPNQEGE